MKQLLLVLSILLFPCLTISDNEVKLFTYWKKGDTQKIVVKEGFIEYEDSKIIKKDIALSYATITVLEESDTSYIVEWNYTHTETDRKNVEAPEEDEMDKRIDEMFDNVKLVFETDEFGEFKQMLNMDELAKMMEDSLSVLMAEEMQDMGEDAELFAEVMKELYSSEAMQDEMTRDIFNYHYYLGRVFAADTVVYYDDVLENQLGGDPFPLKCTITIKTDPLAKTIELNDFKAMDEAQTKEALNDAAKKLKSKDRKKLKKGLKKNPFTIEDIENYTYDYQYGWLKRYERNRIYRAENMRKDRFIIIEEIQ